MIETITDWWGDLDEYERSTWVMVIAFAVGVIIGAVCKVIACFQH